MLQAPCASIIRGLEEIGLRSGREKVDLDREIAATVPISCALALLDGRRDLPFHGRDSAESLLYLFREFGLDRANHQYQRLIDILVGTRLGEPFYELGIGRPGRYLDEHGHGGIAAIRAATMVHADHQLQDLCRAEIEHAVMVFDSLNQYSSLHDFALLKNGRWIYQPGKLFPDFFALKLLAYSDLWKSATNLGKIRSAFTRLKALEPLPQVYLSHKGQIIAPGAYLMREFDLPYLDCDDDRKAACLKRTEWIARMGLLETLPLVASEFHENENEIVAAKITRTKLFTTWGSYSGLALEPDWKADHRRANDIQYRLMKIKHFAAGSFT